MVRTPEQYFQDQDFHLPSTSSENELDFGQNLNQSLTAAEQAFLHKYVGVEGANSMGMSLQLSQQDLHELIPDTPPMEEELKHLSQVQLIFFQVQKVTYSIPIEAVQEVIRYTQPMQLPLSPDYLAGVINLRGRLTPLLYMDKIFGERGSNKESSHSDNLIIVCQCKGIQFGMIIERIESMYVIPQKDISWNVEVEIGASVESICGILEHNKKILGIVSIDKIVNHVLKTRGKS